MRVPPLFRIRMIDWRHPRRAPSREPASSRVR